MGGMGPCIITWSPLHTAPYPAASAARAASSSVAAAGTPCGNDPPRLTPTRSWGIAGSPRPSRGVCARYANRGITRVANSSSDLKIRSRSWMPCGISRKHSLIGTAWAARSMRRLTLSGSPTRSSG